MGKKKLTSLNSKPVIIIVLFSDKEYSQDKENEEETVEKDREEMIAALENQ